MIEKHKILNPDALIGVFGVIPDFVADEISELKLRRDGPVLSISLITKQAVKAPPKRWTEKWDVVYVEISFIGVRALKMDGWTHSNLVQRLEIFERDGDGFLDLTCENSQISCYFDWCRIENIRPGLLGTF